VLLDSKQAAPEFWFMALIIKKKNLGLSDARFEAGSSIILDFVPDN
jgi:hypothetical protein